MAHDRIIGHITLRIPIHAYTERESHEIPEEYTVLEPGGAELIEHDMPARWHASLPEYMGEWGIARGEWTDEHIAATCTREEPKEPKEPFGPSPAEGLFLIR